MPGLFIHYHSLQIWKNLSEKTLAVLEEKGVVEHFYDIQGQELDTTLAERMIGVDTDDLKRCKETICIAFGEKKAEAVLGAVQGKYIDTLIIDDKCAEKILKMISL